jgi:hypothetical protein
MSLYAFTSAHPLKAAAEFREAGVEAFAICMLDRRKAARSVRKSTASVQKPIVALAGYVFAYNPDAWKVSQMKHVRNAVRFVAGGRWQPVPHREAQWLQNPPKGLFHDTDIPRFVNRPAPPVVKVGDVVRFSMGAEQIERPVIGVEDGHTLLMEIRLLGRDVRVKIAVDQVEVAA